MLTTGGPGRLPGTYPCGNCSQNLLGKPNKIEIIFYISRPGNRIRAIRGKVL